ncbi:hypothetical protein DZ860_01885 [Vibrio sinensis]|uniref:Uncharacterized protein n=1 Tax=Vibrio sinensis TaxID=2302434 RepID=A0A3A6QY38_9VIBR|nr:hypothetical protein [Vibrio sinensis]RJX75456.1 hypothetical protein DZ860_01885 [Vibrio sinensis]
MRMSDIIVPLDTPSQVDGRSKKLIAAYKKERTRQEFTEVELNRAKIVMIDENGQMRRISLLVEH